MTASEDTLSFGEAVDPIARDVDYERPGPP